MTVATWLTLSTSNLQKANIVTARLDCLILLEDTLGIDRAHILAHPQKQLGATQVAQLNKKIIQRIEHIPLAYIRGKAAFYGREFVVNKDVLVPRPETEVMIDIVKKLELPAHPYVADIGTGSGCLGITTALEIPKAKVYLYDISIRALKVAQKNAEQHNVKIQLKKQDLFEDQDKPFTILLANLPYVPTNYPVNQDAGHEPSIALFAGADGLDLYRKLWQQISMLSSKPDHVLTEVLPEQHERLSQLAAKCGYLLETTRDLVQHFRI